MIIIIANIIINNKGECDTPQLFQFITIAKRRRNNK